MNIDQLEVRNVRVEAVRFKGRDALRVSEDLENAVDGHAVAILGGAGFRNGVIEGYMAGAPYEGAIEGARGFVGIAFRVQAEAAKFECFYIRPTNGRVEDQLRRNHATQYVSHPDYPWHKLREEHPGVYESYADMQPDEWVHFRIEVEGIRARLYLHGADQPCLIVNDLKLGECEGAVALWIGVGTVAHFADLRLSPLT